jgi:hypothetical protein
MQLFVDLGSMRFVAGEISQIEGNRLTLAAAHGILCAPSRQHRERRWGWAQLAIDFAGARRRFHPAREFYNTQLGVPWEDTHAYQTRTVSGMWVVIDDRMLRDEIRLIEASALQPRVVEFQERMMRDIARSMGVGAVGDYAPVVERNLCEPNKIISPAGRFTDATGKRFDFVFPDELLKQPDVPTHLVPRLDQLTNGHNVNFRGRRAERDVMLLPMSAHCRASISHSLSLPHSDLDAAVRRLLSSSLPLP